MTKAEFEREVARLERALKRSEAARKRLEMERDGLRARIAEALDQQTATSEILRAIASSPTDVQPVFDAIVESAARLCGVPGAVLVRPVGDELHLVAASNVAPEWREVAQRSYPGRLD